MKNLFVLLLAASALITACGSDDDGNGGTAGSGNAAGSGNRAGSGNSAGSDDAGGSGNEAGEPGETGDAGASGNAALSKTFTVTIENVAMAKAFTSSGVFNTPVGDAMPGAATPGKKYEFTINAGRKQKLSFATMLAATNDLFFGPNGNGIALYDANGDPISGDVTAQVQLWDAGTEINEEPKVGPNTVSKQAAPNTGPAENGPVVDIKDATDGVKFAYPAVADVIKVTVTHTTGTEFKVTIENVSTDMALKTSAGNYAAPLSPGVWVVHSGKDPLFTAGKKDFGKGLEAIAEDGNPAVLGAYAAANSGITYPASPGAYVVHSEGTKPLFTTGKPDYGDGIEGIAEDGNPTNLGASLESLSGYVDGAVFNMPVGSTAPGPITPGGKYEFSFAASPGQSLSFATMLAATNDVFFGPDATGIPLFDADGAAVSGDITDLISLWDAGTEGNEEPGIGPNTVTNQLMPNTGTKGENKVQFLSMVKDGYTYPKVSDVITVTISSK